MNCPICNSSKILDIIEIKNIPVYCNILLNSFENALNVPRGNINFVFCENCSHFFNSTFDLNVIEYSAIYENSLHVSHIFQKYAEDLAKYLIDKYNLFHKTIIDIGCGRGDFLKLICNLGNNVGYGFDKSYVYDAEFKYDQGNVRFIQGYYSSKYNNIYPDLILCRHVLEHIPNPVNFLKDLIGFTPNKDTIYYFEVPNVLHILNNYSIWDIIYEHCSYFSESSLAYSFNSSDLQILNINSAYNNQFLQIEAKFNVDQFEKSNEYSIEPSIKNLAVNLKSQFDNKISNLEKQCTSLLRQGKKIVVWGAGSKGVTFLNILNNNEIKYIVDINPRKHGKFISGSGAKIVSPNFLTEYNPEYVFLMNSVYQDEVEQNLEKLNVRANILIT